MSYLTDHNVAKVLAGIHARLNTGSPLLVSTITGAKFEERLETCSTGDQLLMIYRTVDQVLAMLETHGFLVLGTEVVNSPANASQATRDLFVLTQRHCV